MDRDLRIRMLLQAGDKVSRPLRDIVSGSGKAAAALKATRDRLKEIEKAQADLGEFRALKSGLRTAGKELDDARARVARLAAELKQTEAPTKEMRDEFARAKKEAAALGTALDTQRQKLDLTRSRLTDAGVSTRHLVAAERALRDEVKHANVEISEQGRRIVQVNDRMRRLHQARGAFSSTQDKAAKMALGGGAAIGSGVAATLPLRLMAGDAIKFESSMADVRKTVDGMDDPRAFKAMGDAILTLSTRLPMVPDQIAAIVAAGGQIKIPREQLLLFAEDATKMGVAFEVTGEEAGDTMAKWRAAFGLGRDGVVKLADQVNLLGNSGAKTLAVAEIVTRIGALGEVAGLNSGDVAGLAATLSAVGVESEVAATGIKNTMLALTKGASATKDQRAAFKTLGLDAEQVAKDMQRNGQATIVDVMRRIGGLRKDRQAGLMTDLFGSESVAAIAPMLTKLDKLQEFLKLTGDQSKYAGSMNKEFASRAATTANSIILAENNLTALKVTLGTDLLPMITDGAKAIGGISKSLRAFSQENPAVASWLLKIAGGFGTVLIAAGTLQFLGAGIKAGMAPLQFAAKLMGTDLSTAALRFGKGLLYPIRLLPTLARVAAGSIMTIARLGVMFVASNPMLALAIAIGAAIFLVVRHWDTVKGVFNRGVAWISALVPRFRNFGSFLMQGLVNGIAAHFPNLTRILGAAAKIVATVFPKKTEIHSPSRLYHRYGGFLMSGLANGIQAGAAEPVRNLEAVTRRMTDNMVVGSVLPGFGGGAGAPGAGGRTNATAAAPLAPVAPITIQIYGAPGQSEQQMAKLVGEEVRRVLAGNARSRAMSYAEPADYGDS